VPRALRIDGDGDMGGKGIFVIVDVKESIIEVDPRVTHDRNGSIRDLNFELDFARGCHGFPT
jgi:phage protein U